jgi:hypothetical protein
MIIQGSWARLATSHIAYCSTLQTFNGGGGYEVGCCIAARGRPVASLDASLHDYSGRQIHSGVRDNVDSDRDGKQLQVHVRHPRFFDAIGSIAGR